MKASNKIVTYMIGGLFMLVVLVGAFNPEAGAESAADFYKGKKIKWMIGSRPGSTTDWSVRIVAPYLKEYTGASAVIVENVPQAGSVLAMNKLWNSKPDGLTLATAIPNTVIKAEVGKSSGVQYQCAKLNSIWAMEYENGNILTVSAEGPYKSMDDLKKAKGLKSAGVTGKAYTAAYYADLLGLDAKITPGMATVAARLALLRGEIDFFPETITGTLEGIANGNLRPLVTDMSRPLPALPQVPPITKFSSPTPRQEVWIKLVDTANRGKYAFTGPNVPKDRIEYLRSAFEKTFNNPEYLKERKKQEKYEGGVPWLNGHDAQEAFDTALIYYQKKEQKEMLDYLSKKYFTLK